MHHPGVSKKERFSYFIRLTSLLLHLIARCPAFPSSQNNMVDTVARSMSVTSHNPSTHLRSNSATGSDASTTSSSPVTYADEASSASGESIIEDVPVRTTRQKKDWRPKSTFFKKKLSQMTWHEKLCILADTPASIHELKDENLDRGPVPRQGTLRENLFILTRACLPLVVQAASYAAFPSESE